MKRLSFLLLLIFCVSVHAQQRIQIRNVAVVETQTDERSGAANDINKAEIAEITNEIRREAVKNLPRKRFNVMTTETVLAMGDAILESCADENCVISLGSKIGADYIVRGVISKFRQNLTLTIEMYETEYGMLVATAAPVRTPNLEELLERTTTVSAAMYKEFLENAPITMIQDRRQMASEPPPAPTPTPTLPTTTTPKPTPPAPVPTPAPPAYALAVTRNPAVGGTISRSPNQTNYASGTSATVTATARSGYRFTHWSGAPQGVDSTKASITFRVNNNTALTANFMRTYTLTLGAKPARGGNAYATPSQPRYDAKASVTVTAVPNAGYQFSGWTVASGAEFVSKESVLASTMHNDLTLTAHFSKHGTSTDAPAAQKTSPLALTVRWTGAAFAAGGIVGGMLANNAAAADYRAYKATDSPEEAQRTRQNTENMAATRNTLYTLAAVGLGAFTVTLFF